MEIRKEGGLRGAGAPDEARLAKINAYARTPLTAEAVYCFRVRLCDDRPDRDFERFDTAALPRMAELFRGKTGICDHQWSADRQVARIFDTQVVREDDGASCLMAEAYVLRTERNADLIADIEGGIKKEVSVGCAMGQARCSICGEPYGTCAHRKGAVYDGETCLAVLSEPLDAYEFSFVAELSDALRRLSAEAELGRAWRKQLEDGLVALGLSLDLGASEQTLRKAAAALDDGQLQAWKAALDRRAAERYGGGPQLVRTQGSGKDDEAYLI